MVDKISAISTGQIETYKFVRFFYSENFFL
jgi:hypothetical protein